MVVGIDEKILRISDGCQHTAQIRRDGHPCEDRDHQTEGMGLFKERDRKRHEDDEGDVIREYHGGKEGEKEEYLPHPPAIHGLLKETAEKTAEESGAPKSRYDGHERKKERQKRKIDTLSQRGKADIRETCRHERKERRCSKIEISSDKAHGWLLSDGNWRLHEKGAAAGDEEQEVQRVQWVLQQSHHPPFSFPRSLHMIKSPAPPYRRSELF